MRSGRPRTIKTKRSFRRKTRAFSRKGMNSPKQVVAKKNRNRTRRRKGR